MATWGGGSPGGHSRQRSLRQATQLPPVFPPPLLGGCWQLPLQQGLQKSQKVGRWQVPIVW